MTDGSTPNDGSNPANDSVESGEPEGSTDSAGAEEPDMESRIDDSDDGENSTDDGVSQEPDGREAGDKLTGAHDREWEYPTDDPARGTEREDPVPRKNATDSRRIPDSETVGSPRSPTAEPHVSVTIEGEYETVFERLEHPQASGHSELETVVDNIEETLSAVVRTGGGIRSEIYDAVGFELDRPWEIRIYLEVLAMHDLINLQDDQWVPSDHFRPTATDGDSE